MKLLRILFLIFVTITLKGQTIKKVLRNDCSGLPCLDYGKDNYSLNKFIKSKFKEYVNKKKELDKVYMAYKLDNSLLFESNNISVEIFINKDSFEIDTSVKYLYDKVSDSKIYLSEHLKVYYAGEPEIKDNKFKYNKIEKLNMVYKGVKINVPDSVFNKFINPNLNNQYFSLRPIEVYRTNSTICIYIMGDIDIEKNDGLIFNNEQQTYLTKIVYDYRKKAFKTLTLTASELYQYCWPQCENFWPF